MSSQTELKECEVFSPRFRTFRVFSPRVDDPLTCEADLFSLSRHPADHEFVEEFSFKPGLFPFITSLSVFLFVVFISADEAPGGLLPFYPERQKMFLQEVKNKFFYSPVSFCSRFLLSENQVFI